MKLMPESANRAPRHDTSSHVAINTDRSATEQGASGKGAATSGKTIDWSHIDWSHIATHEAAHAVAIVVLGGFVESANLHRDQSRPYIDGEGRKRDVMGIVEGPNFYNPVGLTTKSAWQNCFSTAGPDTFKLFASCMQNEILKTLVGPWAEANCAVSMLSKTNMRALVRSYGGGRDDYQHCYAVIAELRALTGRGNLIAFEDRALEFARSHAVAIEAVAGLLLLHETLEHEAIAEAWLKSTSARNASSAEIDNANKFIDK